MAEKVSSELASTGEILGLENWKKQKQIINDDIWALFYTEWWNPESVIRHSTVNSIFAIFQNMCIARFSFAFSEHFWKNQ